MTKSEKILFVMIVSLVCVVLFLLWRVNILRSERMQPPFGEEREIARVISPDSLVDAIVTVTPGEHVENAIYIVLHGTKHTEKDKSVFFADHVDSLQLIWKEARSLVIKYSNARLWFFRNFWYSGDFQSFKYVVELRLLPPEDRSSLAGKYSLNEWINR